MKTCETDFTKSRLCEEMLREKEENGKWDVVTLEYHEQTSDNIFHVWWVAFSEALEFSLWSILYTLVHEICVDMNCNWAPVLTILDNVAYQSGTTFASW